MRHVAIAEAKSRLCALLSRAESGEEIVITRRGVPVAHLTTIRRRAKKPIDLEWLETVRRRFPPAIEEVAVSNTEYDSLSRTRKSLVEFLSSSPLVGCRLVVKRDRSKTRKPVA